ncbi:MAG: sigma-70 family RNA polymerase sigma factor [Bacteroidota bacterium]|nr:sigma-70 family RNA polymerase sigma factor [Bacteroidota bacterium]
MDDIYIRKVCEGNEEAFRYFLKEYKDMAFTVAVSVVKDEFIAQEVVQDAFVKAYNGLKSFNKKSTFRTWFYRIVINEAFMRLKKLKKEIVSFTNEYKNEVADESRLLSLHEEEQTYLINKALKKLSPKESLALRLFYLQEESIKEVCEITGWSEANTKVILHRARKNMFIAFSQLMRTEF